MELSFCLEYFLFALKMYKFIPISKVLSKMINLRFQQEVA